MTLAIAIVGAGYIGAIHAQALCNLALHSPDEEIGDAALGVPGYDATPAAQRPGSPAVHLKAVVDPSQERREAFVTRFGVPLHFASLEDLLAHEPIDGLVICTPNYLHAPQAITALRQGVSVLVEKPMALDAARAMEMLEAARQSGKVLMVAHCWRFDEEVLWLRNQRERIGTVVRTRGYGVHANWGPTGWFTQPELSGGGALVDMGIHAIDTARFLLGDPLPESVYARLGTYYGDYPVDDTGLVVINWQGGVVSYLESGWWQPYSDGPEAATQLYGKQGFGQLFPTRLLLPDQASETVRTIDPGFVHPRPEHCAQQMYDEQMRHFLYCLANGEQPCCSGEHGLVNMRILEAAYESARLGAVVKIVQAPISTGAVAG
jgi:predicted dehydrogenase